MNDEHIACKCPFCGYVMLVERGRPVHCPICMDRSAVAFRLRRTEQHKDHDEDHVND